MKCTFPKGPTPSKTQLKEKALELISSEPDLTIIKHVQQHFGRTSALITVYAYASKEEFTRYEVRNKKAKKEAAPAPQPEKK